MSKLLPCPFCEAEIEVDSFGFGVHPSGTDCYLNSETIVREDFDAWNRRPSPFDDAVMGEG